MCKHILNAQVSVRAACCKRWFDCPECHADATDHPLKKTNEMVMACKKCKKTFRKDTSQIEEADEYCPHCDNHYVIEAKTKAPRAVPQPILMVEGHEEIKDARTKEAAAFAKSLAAQM